ncbi:MAG: GGDEF domain-containing protein [Desulfobacterium sp.]|nr:GGDEF domain-containing protein [Desulfobacterium sp.]
MTAMNRLSEKLSTAVCLFTRVDKKNADHEKLTRYIVALNRETLPDKIIKHGAACLKEILNHRLFAFAMRNGNRIDVWGDPKISEKSFKNMILKDFNKSETPSLNLQCHSFHPDQPGCRFNLNNLVSHETGKKESLSKLYMVPDRRRYGYHDNIADIVLQSCSLAVSRQMTIKHLSKTARIDPLTGCYNRREFANQLESQIAGAVRHHSKLAVFMFDLDHFKKVNDRYGHLAGDQVLREISLLVRQNMRQGDVFARYGGEEFIAILPDTDKRKAIELADRLRRKIQAMSISHENRAIKVTASFGVASLDPRNSHGNKIIQDADKMLYKAKLKGRNMVMPGLMKLVRPGRGATWDQELAMGVM